MRRDRLPVWREAATSGEPGPAASSRAAASAAGVGGVSEPTSRPAAGLVGVVEAVAKSTDGGDHVGTQLLADAGDEDLDGVGIAVEILVVDVFDQLGAADHLALVMHQVAEQLVLLRGQLDRLAGPRDAARAGVEPHVAGYQLGRGMAARA